jgi:hypothetical protein
VSLERSPLVERDIWVAVTDSLAKGPFPEDQEYYRPDLCAELMLLGPNNGRQQRTRVANCYSVKSLYQLLEANDFA